VGPSGRADLAPPLPPMPPPLDPIGKLSYILASFVPNQRESIPITLLRNIFTYCLVFFRRTREPCGPLRPVVRLHSCLSYASRTASGSVKIIIIAYLVEKKQTQTQFHKLTKVQFANIKQTDICRTVNGRQTRGGSRGKYWAGEGNAEKR